MTEELCLKCLAPLNASDEYEETGLHAPCFATWFKLKRSASFGDFQRRQTVSADPGKDKLDASSWNTSFFHGRFKKYSASLAGQSYIFKVRELIAPELPDVEYVCNQIAKALGLPVPPFYMVKFGGERAFVTKNFIRKSSGVANLVHIYHHLNPVGPYDCETLLEVILRETGKYADAEIFVKTCLYDALVGNHDRHGRNLALLVTAKGSALAPIYDNVSALRLEQGTFLKADWNPAGKIATKASGEPTAKDYAREFQRLGYGPQVTAFAKRIHLKKLIEIIDASLCSSLMKDALTRVITKRASEITNETRS